MITVMTRLLLIKYDSRFKTQGYLLPVQTHNYQIFLVQMTHTMRMLKQKWSEMHEVKKSSFRTAAKKEQYLLKY